MDVQLPVAPPGGVGAHGRLLSKVLSICKRKVFANQRKRARRLGVRDGRSLAVTMIQRFESILAQLGGPR